MFPLHLASVCGNYLELGVIGIAVDTTPRHIKSVLNAVQGATAPGNSIKASAGREGEMEFGSADAQYGCKRIVSGSQGEKHQVKV